MAKFNFTPFEIANIFDRSNICFAKKFRKSFEMKSERFSQSDVGSVHGQPHAGYFDTGVFSCISIHSASKYLMGSYRTRLFVL